MNIKKEVIHYNITNKVGKIVVLLVFVHQKILNSHTLWQSYGQYEDICTKWLKFQDNNFRAMLKFQEFQDNWDSWKVYVSFFLAINIHLNTNLQPSVMQYRFYSEHITVPLYWKRVGAIFTICGWKPPRYPPIYANEVIWQRYSVNLARTTHAYTDREVR